MSIHPHTSRSAHAASLSPGTWSADPIHSAISFRARHMGIGTVRGTFTLASSTLVVGSGGPVDATVRAVIDATSVDTGETPRDQHLQSPDFLDVATYPTIAFVSTHVWDLIDDTFTLLGDLTLHGVTRQVELSVDHLGVVDDPSGVERSGFSATTRISRAAFGIDIELVFGAGNVVVSDAIDIELDLEFVADESA